MSGDLPEGLEGGKYSRTVRVHVAYDDHELNVSQVIHDALSEAGVDEGAIELGDDTRPFDPDEERAWRHVTASMRLITDLGLTFNTDELASAVHVLQGFIVQRMCHRRWPAVFSDWYKKP